MKRLYHQQGLFQASLILAVLDHRVSQHAELIFTFQDRILAVWKPLDFFTFLNPLSNIELNTILSLLPTPKCNGFLISVL